MPEHKYRHLFKTSDEWEHFIKLGAALHDPEEKREFFTAVIEGKKRDMNYEITGYLPKKKFPGADIAKAIVEMLDAAHGKKCEEPVDTSVAEIEGGNG